MKGIAAFLKTAWTRLTSSKVAWLSLPLAVAQVWLALSGNDISDQLELIFSAIWAVLSIFLATNNPADREHF